MFRVTNQPIILAGLYESEAQWPHRLRIVRSGFEPWGPFLEDLEKFSHPESRSKISDLVIR